MILVTRYAPDGQPAAWLDLAARVAHDTASGDDVARPFTARENAAADALVATLERADRADTLRDQLAAGVTALTDARDTAQADIPVAQNLRQTALGEKTATETQRTGVAAFVPSTTYRAADLTAVRGALVQILDRQALILQALADIYAYRVAVDSNAVDTDSALLWLARLASGLLDDPTAP